MNNRYEHFRKLAITSLEVLETLAQRSEKVYYVYCLGKSSCVTEFQLSPHFYDEENSTKDIILFHWSYTGRHPFETHAAANDCGVGTNNCNEHLIFKNRPEAEAYRIACINDLEECRKYEIHRKMCDQFDEMFDELFDDYFNENED